MASAGQLTRQYGSTHDRQLLATKYLSNVSPSETRRGCRRRLSCTRRIVYNALVPGPADFERSAKKNLPKYKHDARASDAKTYVLVLRAGIFSSANRKSAPISLGHPIVGRLVSRRLVSRRLGRGPAWLFFKVTRSLNRANDHAIIRGAFALRSEGGAIWLNLFT